ncbi:hypothetical protein D3C75_838120 [compost metagenome]
MGCTCGKRQRRIPAGACPEAGNGQLPAEPDPSRGFNVQEPAHGAGLLLAGGRRQRYGKYQQGRVALTRQGYPVPVIEIPAAGIQQQPLLPLEHGLADQVHGAGGSIHLLGCLQPEESACQNGHGGY